MHKDNPIMELSTLLTLLGIGTREIIKTISEIKRLRIKGKDEAVKKIKELGKAIGSSMRYVDLFHNIQIQINEAIIECEFLYKLIEAHDKMPINMTKKVTHFGDHLPSRGNPDIYVPVEMILLIESRRKVIIEEATKKIKDITGFINGNSALLNQVDLSRIPALSTDFTNKLNAAKVNLENAKIDLEQPSPKFRDAIGKIRDAEDSLREVKDIIIGYHNGIIDNSKLGFSI